MCKWIAGIGLVLCVVAIIILPVPKQGNKIDNMLKASVYIEAMDEGYSLWSGSGVVAGGRIITAAHVLEGAGDLRILDVNGNEVEYGEFYYSEDNDFGFIIPMDSNLPSVPIVDSNSLYYGDVVYIVGAPFGLDMFPTVTCGIVSGLNRRFDFFGKDFQSQVDAQSWPGNSGGGVFNERGELVGILIGGMWGTDGMSIITPSEVILDDWYLSPLYEREKDKVEVPVL
ncbi:MAG TPA: serine protease [Dehalococcoidia bacterium]|nr:serine protease [Dehalococcoidia bacterium]